MKPRRPSRFPALLILGFSTLSSSIALSATVTWGTNLAAGPYDWQTPANWTGGSAPLAADTANFQKDWTAVSAITLSAPTTINAIQYDDTGASGDITGISITNGGTPANILTFSGTTPTANIAGGTLTVSAASTLGTGFAKSGAGTLALTGTTTGWTDSLVNNVSAGTLTLGASSGPSFTWTGVNKTTGAGTVQFQAVAAGNFTLPATYSVAAGGITANPTSGTFDGTGGLTKTGAGTLTLGTITTNVNGNYDVTGNLNLNGPTAIGAAAVFKGAGTTTINGVASGSSGFTKEGSGTLHLANQSNTFSGAVSATAGTLQLGNLSDTKTYAFPGTSLGLTGATLSLPGTSSGTVTQTYNFASLTTPISLTSSTLAFTQTNNTTQAFNAALAFSGTNSVSMAANAFSGHTVQLTRAITGSGTLTFSTTGNATARNFAISGTSSSFTGTVVLGAAAASSTFNLNSSMGAAAYEIRNAWTMVNNASGALNAATGVSIFNTGTLTLTQPWVNTAASLSITAGTVNVGNTGSSIGTLSGAGGTIRGTGASSALTVNQATDQVYAGALSTNTFALALTKNGAANLTLSGTIDAAIPVTLNNGGLRFAGSKSVASLTQTGGNLQLAMTPTTADLLTTVGGYSSSGGGIEVNFTGPPALSSYNLVNYGGTLTGTPAVTFSGAILNSRYLTNVSYGSGTNDAIVLSITGSSANLTWNGGVSSDFTYGNLNFLNAATPDQFYDFDAVLLDDTAANFSPQLVGALTPGIITFNNSSSDYSLGGAGSFTGAANLIKNGTALLTISTANTYSGFTEINAGRLRLGGDNVLGTGTVYLQGGALSSDGSSARSLSNAIIPSANSTIGNATDNGNLTLSGLLSGSGTQISKEGDGLLTLTAANTFSGTFNVNAGGLVGTVSTTQNSLGTASAVIASGASVQLNNTNTSGTAVAIGNTITGAGLLKLNFAAGTTSTRNTTMPGVGGFNGTIQLSNAGATADKWSAGGINAPDADLIVDSGSQLYITGSAATLSSVSITGTGNSENRGAIRLASTLNAPLSLAGDATIGTEGGTLNGDITSGASGTQTLTLGTSNSSGSTSFPDIIGGGTGTLAVTKAGAGNAILSAANTYSGGTTISGGTLTLGNASALGSGTLTISGGGLNSSVADLVNSQNNAQNWNGNFSFTGTENLDLGTGAVAMNASCAVTVTAKTLTVGGIISGTGFALTKSGEGTLLLTNANTYSGGTTISASGGLLVATSPEALGSGPITISKNNLLTGTLVLQFTGTNTLTNTFGNFASTTSIGAGGSAHIRNASGNNTINSVLNVSATGGNGVVIESVAGVGNLLTLAGNITTNQSSRTHFIGGSGDGLVTGAILNTTAASTTGLGKDGAGTWTLSGTNTYTGSTTISGGILALGTGVQALGGTGTVASIGSILFNGGTLQFSAANAIDYSSRFSEAANMAYRLDTNGQSVNWGTGRNPSGTGSLTKLGTGTLTITTATNRWTGATTINGGTLNANTLAGINTDSSIGKGSVTGSAADLVIAGGTLQHTAANVATSDRLFTIGGTGGLDATLDSSAASDVHSVSFTNPSALEFGSTGARILTVTGSNTGANTLASILGDGSGGATSLVKSGVGTWILTGANTYTGTTTVSGGTLGGTGCSSSVFTVQTGAALSPGASIGTMSTAGTTFDSGSTFKVEINTSTGTADKLVSTGAVTLGGTALSLTNLGTGTLAGGTKLTLIDYTGGSLTGTFTGYAEGAPVVVGSKNFTISYVDSSKVTLTAVVSGYASWAADNANNDPANLDTDGDGVPNGVEYFMGQTGSTFTPNPAPVGNTVTWPKDPSANATYVVQTSSSLLDEVVPGDGGWTTATTGVTDNGTSVVYVIPSGDPKRFTRIKVTIP